MADKAANSANSPISPVTATGRFVLNPSARVLWRSAGVVQLELGSRSVVVDGISGPVIGGLAGPGLPAPDIARPELAAALNTLASSGFLWAQNEPEADCSPAVQPRLRPRLAADLAALRARHGRRAADILAQRSDAAIAVHGTGRLATGIATLLASAGVGHIQMMDSDDVRRHDSSPGGLRESDEGRRFIEAATEAIHRAAPEVDTAAMPVGRVADLAVLAGEAPVDPELRDALHRQGCAHIVARSGADDGVVGPLVLPGLTSCLRCGDLQRLDRDEAWSALAVQLSTRRRHAGPSDIGLVTFTASVTALQALAHLDGDEPASLGGSLELHLPDWRIRRRTWPAHPDCDCGAHHLLAGM